MRKRECDGCKWCCWAFNAEVPDRSLKVLEFKSERSHCQHECAQGCALHGMSTQPPVCRDFACPYLAGMDIHRPDTFQSLLEELAGDMGNYIPLIPWAMNVEYANEKIRETRTIPAAILWEGMWVKAVLPLDRQPDGSWTTTELMLKTWE